MSAIFFYQFTKKYEEMISGPDCILPDSIKTIFHWGVENKIPEFKGCSFLASTLHSLLKCTNCNSATTREFSFFYDESPTSHPQTFPRLFPSGLCSRCRVVEDIGVDTMCSYTWKNFLDTPGFLEHFINMVAMRARASLDDSASRRLAQNSSRSPAPNRVAPQSSSPVPQNIFGWLVPATEIKALLKWEVDATMNRYNLQVREKKDAEMKASSGLCKLKGCRSPVFTSAGATFDFCRRGHGVEYGNLEAAERREKAARLLTNPCNAPGCNQASLQGLHSCSKECAKLIASLLE